MKTVIGCLALLAVFVAMHIALRLFGAIRSRAAWSRARAALGRGDLARAERDIVRCIKFMPDRQSTRFLLGTVLAEQGKLEAAEEQLKLAQSLYPHKPDGLVELGVFYVTVADRVDDGLATFREALEHGDRMWEWLEHEPRLAAFRRSQAYVDLRQEMGRE